jgi:hypothetical protein
MINKTTNGETIVGKKRKEREKEECLINTF